MSSIRKGQVVVQKVKVDLDIFVRLRGIFEHKINLKDSLRPKDGRRVLICLCPWVRDTYECFPKILFNMDEKIIHWCELICEKYISQSWWSIISEKSFNSINTFLLKHLQIIYKHFMKTCISSKFIIQSSWFHHDWENKI